LELPIIRLVALIAGIAVAVVGVGVYQAWWTTAFAVGGLAVAISPSHLSAGRSIVFGVAIAGAGVLGGMSLFFLYGALWGATWWLVATIAAFFAAVALALLASRLQHGASSDKQHR
jgi:hypothetical protein